MRGRRRRRPTDRATASAATALATMCRPSTWSLRSKRLAAVPHRARCVRSRSGSVVERSASRRRRRSHRSRCGRRRPRAACVEQDVEIVVVGVEDRRAARLEPERRSRPWRAAMPATESKNSRCAAATVVITATCGRTSFVSGVISPAWFMPISNTPNCASRGRRASISGTPQWLLKLLIEACVGPPPRARCGSLPWSSSCPRCR